MIKIPSKTKRHLSQEMRGINSKLQLLMCRGKTTTEEDTRMLINDTLSYVLGYDKYTDLKTEYKEKNDRIDYAVKLSEGPHAKKRDKHDFIIEAKSTCIDLKQDHINQTLTYCLNNKVDYFILTNAREWKLFKVINTKSKRDAIQIWECNLMTTTDFDSIAEDMYVFSKQAYINGVWNQVADFSKATEVGELMAIILSDKYVKNICKTLRELHEVKISEDTIKDVITNEVFKDFTQVNKNLLRKLNTPETKNRKTTEPPQEEMKEDKPESTENIETVTDLSEVA